MRTSAGGMAGIGASVANLCTIGNGTNIDGLEVAAGLGAGAGLSVSGCCTAQM